MSSADQWRWTDDEGVQRLLNGDELRLALRDGRLKPTTLVWRRGMKSWQPASEVEELMSDEETVETVTQDHPTNRKPPGVKRAPTPSIPAPGSLSSSGLRPSNMVDIAALRAQQGGVGKRPNTMHGMGDGGRARQAPDTQPIRIPMAPRVPQLGYRGGDLDHAAAVLAGQPPDGGWKEGAARSDDDEETVTKLRDEDEASTLAEPQQRQLNQPRERKRSIPPPRKRTIPPARGGSRPPDAAARTLVSPNERKRADSKVPDPVPSSAVLSEAFPSNVGKARQRAEATMKVENALDMEDRTAPARPHATTPLPAANWQTPSGRPRSSPPVAPRRSAPPPAPMPAPPTGVTPSIPGTRIPQSAVPTVAPPKKSPVITLAMPIIGAAGGALVVLLLIAFLAGRWSVSAKSGVSAVVEARSGWTAVPLFARMTSRAGASQRPCLMLRAPSRYVPTANNRVTVEVLPTPDGKLAVGYAAGPREPRGMIVDPQHGQAELTHEPADLEDAVSRVVPMKKGNEISFASTLVTNNGVINAVQVASDPPFVVGFDGKAAVRMPEPGADATTLWELDPPGKEGDALSALVLGSHGVALAYRYDGKIWYGVVKADGGVIKAAQPVVGSGGMVGKPSLGTNGSDVSVVFADRPSAPGAVAEIRWGRTATDKLPGDAVALELPEGGPGGEAIAPAIAGLTGGRWLLMWTEGSIGNRVLRAQTYDRKYRPLGDALRVSPETGSFGQGTLGIVGETAAVVFFLATTGTYEIWGTVLQCE